MKKHILSALLPVLLSAGTLPTAAQEPDSLQVETLQEAVLDAVRAPKDAPYAVANIDRRELREFSGSGQELPLLFARTPGILAWSENGIGTGTSYMRIRSAGGSRINVTLDGIPLNSPEDQTVFWANMNSYGALMGSIQIQRGVGSSTNGDGAFGGTIALGTKAPSLIPAAECSASYGSYNTRRFGGTLSSGLLWKHLVLEAAYHETATDGYLHGTAGRSGSYLGALSWLGAGFTVSYKLLGNFENTGQAWNGVVAGNDDLSLMDGTYGGKTGIRTYADLCDAGLGRYNSLYESLHIDGDSYTLERYRMQDGSFWPRTTDNFWQQHHILSTAWTPSTRWKLSLSAHYTHGNGWYDEFRPQNKLVKYGIPVFTDAAGNKVKRSDFVRRKGLLQDCYGAVAGAHFHGEKWELSAGLSAQQFAGDHFGYLTYAGHAELSGRLLADGPYRYYDSDAAKLDASCFVKATRRLSEAWSLFADLQYRHVDYRTDGYNDKYIDNGDGTASRHYLDIHATYDFFNPKAGVNFSRGAHRAYASLAMSNREPERNNFTDNGKYPAPKAERLLDGEAGYQYAGKKWQAGINLYYMRYRDQLVQTGEKSDIGEALTTNVADSYRTGVELSAGWSPLPWLHIAGNAAWSRNRLLDFDEYVEDWDNGTRIFHYTDKALAFSPSAILNGFVEIRHKGFRATWHTGYVSHQYLDNTENEDRSLPGYSLTDLKFGYTLKFRKILREIDFGVDMNNLFSARAAQSGWVYSAICESAGHSNWNRYYQIGFVPTAPFTAIGHITLRFL
ncbi:MAG: TonB-dependent receptor plug domain-containing protein [Bacteroidales bacterium]|nr:TonB-dependent receptor plug domain-containing protein [Bacteroidales bacterium]